jgi:hypothetical protein
MIERRVVRNILDSLAEKIVSKKQLISAFRNVIHNESVESLIANLRRNGEILYVFKGYYYILDPAERQGGYTKYSSEEMVYATLNNLNIRWYLGLESALERNRITWQGVVSPIIINSSFSGNRRILGIPYRFRKMKRSLFEFGFVKKTTKNRIVFYYSDPEKTLLDYQYFHRRIPDELSPYKHTKTAHSYVQQYSQNSKRKVTGL